MATIFNDEQKQAIESFTDKENPKSVFVSASAGTGKTTMITEAYVKLLAQKIPPSRIVAITFTNNATNEMFMRIRSLVRKNIYENTGEDKKRWANIYNQLTRDANISTIDKFASKLIKKYSYKLDLLPSINIISDYDEQNIRTIKNIIENIFKKNGAKYENIYSSIKLYEQHKKDAFIENIIRFINNIKPSIGSFENFKNSLLQIDIKEYNQNIYIKIRNDIDSIYQYDHSGSTATKAKTLLDIHKNKILDFDEIIKLYETQTDPNKEQLRQCLASTTALIKELKVGRLEELKEIGENLTTKLLPYYRNMMLNIVLRVDYKDNIENIIDFIEEIFNEYEEQKTLSNSLTFNDLISKAIELLKLEGEDKYVADEIRSSIEYLIVDETQDTNDLQYSLVNHLLFGCNDVNEKLLQNTDKVAFIVGDRKQSIYRFRNANITSFLNLEEIFKNGGKSESIYLNKNYRSYEHLINFFNNIFYEIFKDDEIKYLNEDNGDKLISQKPSNTQEQKNKTIEYLIFEDKDKNQDKKQDKNKKTKISAAEAKKMEAHAVAYHIRKKYDADENLQYDKFALLLPVLTNLHNYIEAFTKYDIPFYISSGKGFFSRSEIAHLINFLKYLVLKENQLLPLILNKTFFDINEGELYQINEILLTTEFLLKDLFSLEKDEALKSFDNYPDLKEKIMSIRNIIFKLFDYAHFENSSVIINTIINETKFNAYLMTTNEAEFAYSNVEKFIVMAHEHERDQSGNNIYTFVESICSQANADEKYSSVPLLKVNAITIMTVHASKGLEFDNVVIGSLSSARRSNFHSNEFAFIDEHAHIPIHADDEVFELCKVDKNFDIEKQKSERRRLLYVALTRAKESLTLIGEGNAASYRAAIEEYYISTTHKKFTDDVVCDILEHDYSSSNPSADTKQNNIHIDIYKYNKDILEVEQSGDTNNPNKIGGASIKIRRVANCESPKKIILRASDGDSDSNETDDNDNSSNLETKIDTENFNKDENNNKVFLHNISSLLDNKIAEYLEHEETEWYQYNIFGSSADTDDKEYNIGVMDVGTIVHEILELFNHKEYQQHGEEYMNILVGNAQKQLKKYSNGAGFIPMVKIAIHNYINHPNIQAVINGTNEIFMREHSFEKRSPEKNGDIKIMHSKIDLITHDAQNDIYYIIDYKFASAKNCKYKNKYINQMNAYKNAMSGFLKIDDNNIKTKLMYLL